MRNKWFVEEVDRKIKGDINKKLTLAGEFLVGVSQAYTPVKTGELRSTTDYKVEGQVLRISNPTEYAPFVEFGTGVYNERIKRGFSRSGGISGGGQKPQPFLRPLLNYKEDIIRIISI